MIPIYNTIGDGYDTTRKADKEIVSYFRNMLDIDDEKYLDVACGTGNYTSEIVKFGGKWFAFDHSDTMLIEARRKSELVDWKRYDAENTGYDSEFFSGAICSLAIHHFPSLPCSLKEISRVLKKTANLVIFTSTPEQMEKYWLNTYFPEMMNKSCAQMPSLSYIQQSCLFAGLEIRDTKRFYIRPDLEDFFLYSGKQQPEMYLSQKIRDGISSFRNLCSASELRAGLDTLSKDIQSGKIKEVIKSYENEIGDYLFVVASKVNKPLNSDAKSGAH